MFNDTDSGGSDFEGIFTACSKMEYAEKKMVRVVAAVFPRPNVVKETGKSGEASGWATLMLQ